MPSIVIEYPCDAPSGLPTIKPFSAREPLNGRDLS